VNLVLAAAILVLKMRYSGSEHRSK